MSKVNILVVDDRPEGVLSVQAVLNNPEYNLVTAASGSEALKHLLVNDFAVILLDVQMPIMNGFETAAMIKTRESSKDIPIIFMSAINQDEQYVYQGYHAGAVDYLLKPFDPYILRSKVAIFVDIFKKKLLIQEQARKIYENELQTYAQALDRMELESLKRYQYLADSIPQIVLQLRPDGGFQYFNKVWQTTTGLQPDSSLGLAWLEAIHPDDRKHFMNLDEAPKHNFEFEARIKNQDKHYRWYLFRFEPEFYTNADAISSWLGTATDIEDRKQSEDSHRYLAQAGELLVSSLDYEAVLKSIAKLAVPQLADWCSIDIFRDREWHNVTIVHNNPEKLELVREFQSRYLANPNSKIGAGKVLLTGKTEVYPHITKEMIENLTLNDDHKHLARELNDKSAMIIPMAIKGKIFGTLTFVFSDSGRRYNEGYVEMAEELGRRCALAYENSRLYKIAQESIEVRNEFLSIASHELNTPITSLKLHLQMTKKSMTTGNVSLDRFSKSIDASIRQVDRLINLIEVLLDISRIQSGKLALHMENFDLSDVVRDLSERLKEVLGSNCCNLKIHVPEHVNVKWDKMRIEQILLNLTTNAIKYAPGDIDVTVEEEQDKARIIVRDYGEGIPEEKLNSIFDRFERASSNRSIGGLGLGLFIVKQIVEGHGGSIQVESIPKKGSVFTVTLPFNTKSDHSSALIN